MMCAVLGLSAGQIREEHDVEFPYTHQVHAIVSFLGKKKKNTKSMCVVIIIMLRGGGEDCKMKGQSFLFVIFQNNDCGFSPHGKDAIYFLMMSCFPEKQSGILSTPYGGGKTDSTVFHLLGCLLHFCIHNLCGGLCDCQNIQMGFS